MNNKLFANDTHEIAFLFGTEIVDLDDLYNIYANTVSEIKGMSFMKWLVQAEKSGELKTFAIKIDKKVDEK